MTKIKNTKKGMAKKTLSVSLAVAMLATSNVPVWAAEFSDGADAVFTSEVEAPVAEEEAPVVEEAESEAAAVTVNSQTDSRLDNVVVRQNGWASNVSVSGRILESNLTNPLSDYNYQWMVKKGDSYRAISDIQESNESNLEKIDKFAPGAENIGKELYLHIWRQDAGQDNIDVYLPAGTVEKENLNNRNRDNVNNFLWLKNADEKWDDAFSGYVFPYSKTEIKPAVDSVQVKFDNGTTLSMKDFEISYTHAKGNFIDADSECEVVATPKDSSLYTGIFTQKYRICERVYDLNDITAVTNKTYEYTGGKILPAKNDITLTESVRKTVFDSERVIDKIWSDDANNNVGPHNLKISLIDAPNYVQETVPGQINSRFASIDTTYKVVARDLATCKAEIDAVSLNGKSLDTIVNSAEFAKSVHIYGADGKELNLKLNEDYEFVLPTVTPSKNGTYDVTIKAKGSNTKNHLTAKLTITTHDFMNADFIDRDNNKVTFKAVPYTGETVSQNLTNLRFAKNVVGGGTWEPLTEGLDYKVTFAGVDAGTNKGRVIVEGLRSYEGAKKVYTFDITAAKVEEADVKAAGKVVFDRGNVKASDYAPAVTVKAHNGDGCTGKAFTLEAGKDYTVKYAFKTRNEIRAKIVTTVTITNPNFKGTKTVFTRETTISRKQLSDCTIKVLGTYTYTGAAIIPDVEVKDGDEVLVKGVDYEVSASNNVNVGKEAIVTVTGKDKNSADPADPAGDGIYDPESSLSTKFEITPADAKDVKVVFAKGNTDVTYTGKAVKPTIVAVTLNGNDVTQQFDISYPGTYINVGKGMVVLTPVKSTKNFVGTKDASFNIRPRELTGTLTVYDKNGQKYGICTTPHSFIDEEDKEITFKHEDKDEYVLTYPGENGRHVEFDYDGNERTFEDAEFVPIGEYAKYVTENDYEIKYVDNVYGGEAYIYVVGKGNFAGTAKIVDAENQIINSVVAGTNYKFQINTYQFKDQHVVINDAEYAAGQSVKPEVTVTVMGNKLKEGTDYILHYDNRTELTNGKTQKVVVEGIKAFANSWVEGYYAVVKRDMKNTDVTVTEKANGTYDVVVKNTGVVVPESEYTLTFDGDNSVTVTANKDSKYYTGSQTKEIEKEEIVKPEAPVITNVSAAGNKVNVVLSGAEDGATGYDYVISRDRNCITSKAYDDVNKNILNNSTTFTYVQTGSYYVYCHSWVRDENGKKVFSDWSNPYPVIVSAITPDTPKITSVSVSGSTVTVTYTQTTNASGYDVVLGTAVKKVAGEKRPVNYGTLVEKNIKGDKVTATFKNVPAGTYYAGLHAFNRTSENGTKVFSPWSATKTVKVK